MRSTEDESKSSAATNFDRTSTLRIWSTSTFCCWRPRMNGSDLTVNILTNHAVHRRRIEVFGGDQLRPNIHIEDLVDLYLLLLEAPDERIRSDGEYFDEPCGPPKTNRSLRRRPTSTEHPH